LPLVKKIFFGTMLFPNFYVPSMRIEFRHFCKTFPHESIASVRLTRGYERISPGIHETWP